MTRPEPTHLDQRDPAKADVSDIRREVEREIEAYQGLSDLTLLVPDDRWEEFLRLTGCRAEDGETSYRGARLRPAGVTAVVVQEGF